jgi:hypothetical protein
VFTTIHDHNIASLSGKRLSSYFDDPKPRKKCKLVKYDRERARQCVMDDWLGPIPCFPDKTFERTFQNKHGMVDTIMNHLAKDDCFWRQMACRAGKPIICLYVKFLCAQKMLRYGVSASAFIDYFQIGETTSGRCLSHLTRGLVCCNGLAVIYLRKPTKQMQRKLLHCTKMCIRYLE